MLRYQIISLGCCVSDTDLLSGSMLFLARRATRNRDKYKYPVGKQRVQPIATIIFACLMGMSALQVHATYID